MLVHQRVNVFIKHHPTIGNILANRSKTKVMFKVAKTEHLSTIFIMDIDIGIY